MLSRFGVGATVATIPATAAISGAAADWPCGWVILSAAIALVVLVFSIAPYLPILNRVPGIGAPRFKVVLRVNGMPNAESRIRIAKWANTSIIEVGVVARSRAVTVTNVWMNFLIPSVIRMYRCDKVGIEYPDDTGKWEPFHLDKPGDARRCDYWSDSGWQFEWRLSRILRFKVRFPEPGEYTVRFKLGAPTMLRDQVAEATIVVEEVDDADLNAQDRMGDLITQGERVLRDLTQATDPGSSQLRVRVSAIVAGASPILRGALDGDQLPQVPASADGTGLIVPLRDTIDALYVVRDDLGRGGLTSSR